jgi:hypothetical protein
MNIAMGTYVGAANISSTVSDLWYNGEINEFPGYGQSNLNVQGPGSTFDKWGHFSQVAWADTQQIGCGSVPCANPNGIGSGYFTVCMYWPPGKLFSILFVQLSLTNNHIGNFIGDFTKVHTPLGQKTVTGIKPQ